MSTTTSTTLYNYNFPDWQDSDMAFTFHSDDNWGDTEAFALYAAIVANAPRTSGTVIKVDNNNVVYGTDYTAGTFS